MIGRLFEQFASRTDRDYRPDKGCTYTSQNNHHKQSSELSDQRQRVICPHCIALRGRFRPEILYQLTQIISGLEKNIIQYYIDSMNHISRKKLTEKNSS